MRELQCFKLYREASSYCILDTFSLKKAIAFFKKTLELTKPKIIFFTRLNSYNYFTLNTFF